MDFESSLPWRQVHHSIKRDGCSSTGQSRFFKPMELRNLHKQNDSIVVILFAYFACRAIVAQLFNGLHALVLYLFSRSGKGV